MNATQFSNLLFLRDTVIPWMEKHPERVDFDRYVSECGSFACLLGRYKLMRNEAVPIAKQHPKFCVATDFGINSWRDAERIFGLSFEGTLADRKARLNAIIAEHAPKFQEVGMPFHALMEKLTAGTLEAVK